MMDLARLSGEGKVDIGISPLLDIINNDERFYTLSSCAGRIGILEIPGIGDKVNAKFRGKWHRPVELVEVREALASIGEDLVFLIMQSPVIHVACRCLGDAGLLKNIAVASGLKYSSIKNAQDNIMVELLSTERLDIPLARGGKVFPEGDYLEFMIERANAALLRARGKLERLEENLTIIPKSI